MPATTQQCMVVIDVLGSEVSTSFVRSSLVKLANAAALFERDDVQLQLGLALVKRANEVSVHLLSKPQSFNLKDFHVAISKLHASPPAAAAVDTKKLGEPVGIWSLWKD